MVDDHSHIASASVAVASVAVGDDGACAAASAVVASVDAAFAAAAVAGDTSDAWWETPVVSPWAPAVAVVAAETRACGMHYHPFEWSMAACPNDDHFGYD